MNNLIHLEYESSLIILYFFSDLGKKLQSMEYVPTPVAFEAISCEKFPFLSPDEIKSKNLSQDQHLFISLCCGVIKGEISSDIIGRKLGPLNHARWLTLGQRILSLYASTTNPSKNLQQLAVFTIRHYGCVWFLSRIHSNVLEAPPLLFEWIKGISLSDPDTFQTVKGVVENGSYWFHGENLLLACLGDKRENVRQKSIDRILELRNDVDLKKKLHEQERQLKKAKKCMYKQQRLFIKPTLNYEAEDYVDCINWEKDAIHEPPYTRNMSDEELKGFTLQPLTLNIASNTVLTERSIRDMDNLSLATTSQEKQDGMIIALQESRKNKIKK